eukprot:1187613-Prorocentrum_minimum.AAC.2
MDAPGDPEFGLAVRSTVSVLDGCQRRWNRRFRVDPSGQLSGPGHTQVIDAPELGHFTPNRPRFRFATGTGFPTALLRGPTALI